jgi:transcriptional regulator with XRE-family HTH domain
VFAARFWTRRYPVVSGDMPLCASPRRRYHVVQIRHARDMGDGITDPADTGALSALEQGELEREELEELDEALRRLAERIEEIANGPPDVGGETAEWSGKVDETQAETFAATRRRLLELGLRLEDSPVEARRLAELQASVIGALAALEDPAPKPLDKLERFLVQIERGRHVIRDALDERPPCGMDDVHDVATWLAATLQPASQRELAALAGVSLRQFQRWLKAPQGRPPSPRAALVAKLVTVLLRAWTPRGVAEWFRRPRRDLGSLAPVELLGDPIAREEELLAAVRRGRAQHGT